MGSASAARSAPEVEPAGFVVWFTGLSGAGKSTLAEAVAPRLRALGRKVEILDGDELRACLSPGLGFSREDRDSHVARIAFVARLLVRNGVVVLVSAISPFREARDRARASVADFVEVHVATPLAECIRRDAKGLYARALAGALMEFTGISAPYEEPIGPEMRIDTSAVSVNEGTVRVLARLRELGLIEDSRSTA